MQILRNINRLTVCSLSAVLFWALLCGMADCPKTLAMPGNHMLVSGPDTTIHMIVDVPPKFKDGSLQVWISRNVRYPQEAMRKKIEGKVFVGFVIDQEGKICDVQVVKGVDSLLDEEAARVVKSMPDWIPGILKGRTVRVRYTMPIVFKLSMPSASDNPMKVKMPTPTEYYDGYMRVLVEQEQKLQGKKPLADDEKASVGSKNPNLFKKAENDHQAYTSVLNWIKEKSISDERKMLLVAGSLGFNNKIQKGFQRINNKEKKARIKSLKSIGEKDFIHRYMKMSVFEKDSYDIKTRCAIREMLSPGDHKRYIEAIYAKEMARMQSKISRISEIKDVIPYHMLKQKPVFSGGNLAQWIGRQVKYPPEAFRKKAQGKVFIDFIIDTEGAVRGVKVAGSSGNYYLDLEGLRVINSMPRWTPGYKDGKPVKTIFTIPVIFSLVQ